MGSCQIIVCLTNISDYCQRLQPKDEAGNFDYLRANIKSLVPLIYGLPTVAISISVIYILLRKKGRQEFRGSFYKCFAAACLIMRMDTIIWLYLLFFKELAAAPIMDPVYSLIPENFFINNLAVAGTTFFTVAAFVNPVVLSLNRFVCIVYYLQDKYIWYFLSRIIFVAYIFVPFSLSWHLIFFIQPVRKCRIQNFNQTVAYHTFNQQSPTIINDSTTLGFTIMISGIVSATINTVTIVTLFIRRKIDGSKPEHLRRRTPELKLLLIALLECLNTSFEASVFVLMRKLPKESVLLLFLYDFFPFLLDWFYLSNVWIMVILVPDLRKRLFQLIKPKQMVSVGSYDSNLFAIPVI